MPDPTPPVTPPAGDGTPPTAPVAPATPPAGDPTPPAAPGAGQPDPNATPPAQPVVLSLKLPEQALLDQAGLDRTTKALTDLQVGPEHAQKIVEHVNAEVQAFWQAKESEAVKLRTVVWVDQVKADPEIGGAQFTESMSSAAKARQRYFTPEFDKMLESSGLGNHPEFVRAWAKVGKELGQSALLHPNNPHVPQNPPKSLAERIWQDK